MRWFLNLKTAQKLWLAFGTALSIAVVVGVVGNGFLQSLHDEGKRVLEVTRGPLVNMLRVRNLGEGYLPVLRRIGTESLLTSDDTLNVLQLARQFREQAQKVLDARPNLVGLARDVAAVTAQADDAAASTATLPSALDDAIQTFSMSVEDLPRPEDVGADKRLGDGARVQVAFGAVMERAQGLESLLNQLADQGVASMNHRRQQGRDWMLWGAAAGALIAGWVSVRTARAVVSPLRDMTAAAHRISEGDLTAEITHVSEDEVGGLADSFRNMQGSLRSLAREAQAVAAGDLTHEVRGGGELGLAFNRMVGSLRGLLSEIQEAGGQVRGSSGRLHAGLDAAARVSMEEAEVVERVRGTIDALSETATSISVAAAGVERTAEEASRAAAEGSRSVGAALEGMARIQQRVAEISGKTSVLGDKVRRIGEVLRIIQDVAGEIHMLALNAAIESAASAGEHGKRFTVVAGEVRRLAERTRQAAEEISAILTEIQEAAEVTVAAAAQGAREAAEGAQTAGVAGRSLEQVTQGIHSTARAAREISQTTNEQRRNSESVAASMREIARAVRQMAEGTEGSSRAVRDLAALSERFEGLIRTFRTG